MPSEPLRRRMVTRSSSSRRMPTPRFRKIRDLAGRHSSPTLRSGGAPTVAPLALEQAAGRRDCPGGRAAQADAQDRQRRDIGHDRVDRGVAGPQDAHRRVEPDAEVEPATREGRSILPVGKRRPRGPAGRSILGGGCGRDHRLDRCRRRSLVRGDRSSPAATDPAAIPRIQSTVVDTTRAWEHALPPSTSRWLNVTHRRDLSIGRLRNRW